MLVFEMKYNQELGRQIINVANIYHTRKLLEYISLPTQQQIDYTIKPFDYTSMKLQGIYDDFYVLINNTSAEETSILSVNEDKLRGFCGWINRITT